MAAGFAIAMAVIYYLVVNIGSFYLFRHDKQLAQAVRPRISERTLQTSAIVGGFLGGVAAMRWYRHKTSKPSFYLVYSLLAAIHITIVVLAIVYAG